MMLIGGAGIMMLKLVMMMRLDVKAHVNEQSDNDDDVILRDVSEEF